MGSRFARRSGTLGLVATVVVAGACVARTPSPWLAPAAREHPLVGTIWSVDEARAVDRAWLVAALAAADVILLGDKHDNPDHHRLQAALLDALGGAGRRGPVVLELIGVDRAPELRAAQARPPTSPADVRDAAGDAARGWDWEGYAPVVNAALDGGRPLVAGDLSLAARAALRGGGLDALAAASRRALGLDVVTLAPAVATALADDVRAAHCGHAPPDALPRMIDAQRARDAQLARALVDARDRDGGVPVLIAGADHVRRDRGVPLYLRHWLPAARLAVVALLEVTPGAIDAAAAVAARFGAAPVVDYVWFTPRVDLADPCEAFRAQLERLRHSPE